MPLDEVALVGRSIGVDLDALAVCGAPSRLSIELSVILPSLTIFMSGEARCGPTTIRMRRW